MLSHAITTLERDLRGRLVQRADADYEEARRLYNGMIDKRPLMIAQCADVADVVSAVTFGREQELRIAIRGGGHSGPGLGSVDDGLVIDLSAMRGVRVDPATRTVRVEAGCRTGDVDHATHAFGLAVPFGIVSTTGVSGLTLGGGMGYLTRAHGLTIDNLVEADVVLADGRFVTANAQEHSDLFWALRGGGGNFGVVTSFLFRAHPVTSVFAGPVFWEASHAKSVMRAYRDFLPGAPEALGLFVGLKTVPSTDPFPREFWGTRACAVIGAFNGREAEGRRAMAPLLDALPAPIFNWMSAMPFPAMQALFDPLLPKGLQWYWKGDFVRSLPDEAIDVHIAQAHSGADGVVADASLSHRRRRATRRERRDGMGRARCDLGDGDRRHRPRSGACRGLENMGARVLEAVHPFNQAGGYVNFMMDDEGPGRAQAAYGQNYARLLQVKDEYDPANLFRVNQNITRLPLTAKP